jgi:hypothetical protein
LLRVYAFSFDGDDINGWDRLLGESPSGEDRRDNREDDEEENETTHGSPS